MIQKGVTIVRILLLIVLLPATALAQQPGGEIGIFRDNAGISCALADASGMVEVFVVHTDVLRGDGQKASTWSAPLPSCLGGTGAFWVSDRVIVSGVPLGDTQSGISIGYSVCEPTPIALVGITYFGQGTAPNCCTWSVLPHPLTPSGLIEGSSCGAQLTTITGQSGRFGSEAACGGCGPPTEESTWGGIKETYR